MIEVNVTDLATPALQKAIRRFSNHRPALKAIGEIVLEFTKERFDVSTDPYGVPWLPNKASTLENYLAQRTSGRHRTQKGALTAKAQRMLVAKKPLIGVSRSLSKQFHYRVLVDSVEVRSSMKYAAMQQFGGNKTKFPHLWGNIPPRPFFPNGLRGMPPRLEKRIFDVLREAFLPQNEQSG